MKAHILDCVFVDTPGQIDVVSKSACGPAFAKAFASSFPTVIAFVIDSLCSSYTATFMTNMILSWRNERKDGAVAFCVGIQHDGHGSSPLCLGGMTCFKHGSSSL